jgi:hypothetical protein
VTHSLDVAEQQIMLTVLGLIDVVMISNLLMMVIVGGFETFVSRPLSHGNEKGPRRAVLGSGVAEGRLAELAHERGPQLPQTPRDPNDVVVKPILEDQRVGSRGPCKR